jgi:hypothetical protein
MLDRIVVLATLVYSKDALTVQFAANQKIEKMAANLAVSFSVKGVKGASMMALEGGGRSVVCSSVESAW